MQTQAESATYDAAEGRIRVIFDGQLYEKPEPHPTPAEGMKAALAWLDKLKAARASR